MKRWIILISLFLTALVACRNDASETGPASAESIEKYLDLIQIKSAMAQLESQSAEILREQVIQPAMRETFQENGTPQGDDELRTAFIGLMMKKTSEIVSKEFGWDAVKPRFIEIFSEVFTQREIDDLIAFYQSPSGQSIIEKQPIAMERTMMLTREILPARLQKSGEIFETLRHELLADGKLAACENAYRQSNAAADVKQTDALACASKILDDATL